MDTIKKFIRNSGVFFIGNVFSKVIVIFLLPIYTKYISSAEYGYYDLSVTYSTVVTSMIFFEVWVGVMRYMYDGEDNKYKEKVIISGWAIFICSTIVYLIMGIGFNALKNVQYFWYILLYGLSISISNMYAFISRGYSKNIPFAVSGVINAFSSASINIILIVFFKFDFSALYIAAIIGNMAQIIYLEFKLGIWKNTHISQFDSSLTKCMLKYIMPLCVNSAAFWVLSSYNRVVINSVMTISDNGIYAVASKFSMAIAVVTTCCNYAWQDVSFSRNIEDDKNGVFYTKASQTYMIFMTAGTVMLLAGFKIAFPILVGNSYAAAEYVIPLALISSMISAYTNFIGNIFYTFKQTKTIFISMVISCLFNLIMCKPFIIILGLNGASFSVILSFVVNLIIRFVILNKLIGLKVNFKMLFYLISYICFSMIVYCYTGVIVNMIWLCGNMLIYMYVLRNFLFKVVRIVK